MANISESIKTFFIDVGKKVENYIKDPSSKGVILTTAVATAVGIPLIYHANERQKNKLKEMQEIAESKGGRCLSKVYVSAHAKLEWECKEGHTWFAIPSNVKRGTWCPKCRNRKGNIPEMQKLAELKGGRCLSKVYVGAHTKLKWECNEGHTWLATPGNIKRGIWCPKCRNRKRNIPEMQKLAELKGGRCLSKAYLGSLVKLRWECKNGHTWLAIPASVKRGTWCPKCPRAPKIHLKKKWLKKMQEIAQINGGKCLSKEYIDTFTPLEWECAKGHRWIQSSTYLRKLGVWCPYKCRKQLKQNFWRTTNKSWGKKR